MVLGVDRLARASLADSPTRFPSPDAVKVIPAKYLVYRHLELAEHHNVRRASFFT